MKTQFLYKSFTHTFRTIDDVMTQMRMLDEELVNTELQNLIAFNHTYLIITETVSSRFGHHYFSDDALMQQLDINFAQYYFNPLKDYVAGKTIPQAWQILFDACKNNNLYQAIYMGMGVNAHVNNDLGQSLFDVVDDEGYESDFNKVNKLIDLSIPKVIHSLKERSRLSNTTKNIALPLYTFILRKMIRRWRQNAWNNFIGLKQARLTPQMIEGNAEKIARRLAFCKDIL